MQCVHHALRLGVIIEHYVRGFRVAIDALGPLGPFFQFRFRVKIIVLSQPGGGLSVKCSQRVLGIPPMQAHIADATGQICRGRHGAGVFRLIDIAEADVVVEEGPDRLFRQPTGVAHLGG